MRPVRRRDVEAVVQAFRAVEREIPTDVLGSYTGQAFDGDRPIQDADDL